MNLPLKPNHLGRYKDVARLLVRYGRHDVVKHGGFEAELEPEARKTNGKAPSGEEFAKELERMGPTFTKLGQLLSTRGDLLPVEYIQALERLQDDVEPVPYDEIEKVITEELGVRISKAFAVFEGTPLAAASLGQVHRAALRDGRQVVVKVQRPGIRARVADDLEVLEEIAALLDKHTRAGKAYEFGNLIQEFRKSLLAELDYRREAQHLTTLGENLAEFEKVVVPQPVSDYSTSRVLTMDYIPGVKVTSVSPLTLTEIDGNELAEELFRGYLKQIFVDGFFHADPHPGNVFLADDGRVALLDLGMVARLSHRLQERLLQLVLAVSDGRADEAADISLTIAERREHFDEAAFRRAVAEVVARNLDVPLGELQVGRSFIEMAQRSASVGLHMPTELTMLGKALMNLDGIGRLLAPDFNPQESLRRHATKIMNQRLLKSLSLGNVFNSVLEVKDLVERLPGRVNRIMDAAANNQLGIKVDTGIDAVQFMVGLQKVANRITVGLVIAALIIGAAMLMRIPSGFTILGYPGLAMLFFLAAGSAGLALIFQSLFRDLSSRKAAESATRTKPV